MDKKKQKAVRKAVGQESAFVDMLNQEVKELQENMEIVNLENELYNIQTYSYMEIYPCRQKQSNRIVAEHLIMKGYRKESDTAREILQRGKYCMPSGLREWIEERYGVEVIE